MEIEQGTAMDFYTTGVFEDGRNDSRMPVKTIQSICQRESQTNGVNCTKKQSATSGVE